jgi:hypothetical protein
MLQNQNSGLYGIFDIEKQLIESNSLFLVQKMMLHTDTSEGGCGWLIAKLWLAYG